MNKQLLIWIISIVIFYIAACDYDIISDEIDGRTQQGDLVACFKIETTQCEVPCTLTFDANCSINGINYDWDFDGNGIFDLGGSEHKIVPNYTFTEEGEYNVNLQVSNGNMKSDTTVTIIVFGPLQACFNTDTLVCNVKDCNINFYSCSQPINEIKNYEWDFDGDGKVDTSGTELDTIWYKYKTEGTYEAELKITNFKNESNSTNQTIQVLEEDIIIQNVAPKGLAGDSIKVWKLAREFGDKEFPIVLGNENFTEIWWALGLQESLITRDCTMENEYVFTQDGRFVFNTNGFVYAEPGIWRDGAGGLCVDETNADLMKNDEGEDLRALGSGEHTFAYDSITSTLTLNGLGAHIGSPSLANHPNSTLQESITYKISKLETIGPVDELQLEIATHTFLSEDRVYYQVNLVSYDDWANEPGIENNFPVACFESDVKGRTVSFSNISINGGNCTWDFGDGNTSSIKNPTHTYSKDGEYTVTLILANSNGFSEFKNNIIIDLSFTSDEFSGTNAKTWKLAPIAGAIKIGPDINSGAWWQIATDDITYRSCQFNDRFVFTSGGEFIYYTNGYVWAEEFMGIDPQACISEEDLPENLKAWGSGSYSYFVTEAKENEEAKITVSGTGAFIGSSRAYNGGEYLNYGPPMENRSITYDVINYFEDGNTEFLYLTINSGEEEDRYWTFILISE